MLISSMVLAHVIVDIEERADRTKSTDAKTAYWIAAAIARDAYAKATTGGKPNLRSEAPSNV